MGDIRAQTEASTRQRMRDDAARNYEIANAVRAAEDSGALQRAINRMIPGTPTAQDWKDVDAIQAIRDAVLNAAEAR